jgi:hypothetical protein
MIVLCPAALEKNTKLKRLDLAHCSIKTSNGVLLAEALQHNTTLKILNLWDNGLKVRFTEFCSEQLQLYDFYLADNPVKCKGQRGVRCCSVAGAKSHNYRLEVRSCVVRVLRCHEANKTVFATILWALMGAWHWHWR